MRRVFTAPLLLSVLVLGTMTSCRSTFTTPKASSGMSQTLRSFTEKVHPIEEARRAWDQLKRSDLSAAEEDQALKAYHLSVDQVVRELKKHKKLSEWTEWMSLKTGSSDLYPVRIDMGVNDVKVWSPNLFDDLDQVKLRVRIGTDTLRWDGFGRIYVGVRKPKPNDPNGRFLPPRGQHLPVTAVLDFSTGATPMLRFLDPREVQTYPVGKRQIKVAADYLSAAHASLQNRSALRVAFGGLTRPEKWLETQGLYMMEPYRGDKIPVVFVHGLFSEPHIWENHVRALMADPEIGSKVQCWYYIYPTGIPIANSSSHLRAALQLAEELQDPYNKFAKPEKIMLVGHSMGGILSRLQATDSGYVFWNAWFKRPPDQVPLEEEIRKQTSRALFFNANPNVDRLVFIATPHRGSRMATSWIGTVASALIRLPFQTANSVTSILSLDLDYIRFEVGKNKYFLFNSIGSLSPDHPMLTAMNQRPIQVPYHSIIGTRGLQGPLEKSSDGVVEYRSSHVNGAESEMIVPYWHGCVPMRETVEEVRRIAELHVKKANAR